MRPFIDDSLCLHRLPGPEWCGFLDSLRWLGRTFPGRKCWCGRVDSNHHALASASPSSWCVCQFRHDRKEVNDEIVTEAASSWEPGSARAQVPASEAGQEPELEAQRPVSKVLWSAAR